MLSLLSLSRMMRKIFMGKTRNEVEVCSLDLNLLESLLEDFIKETSDSSSPDLSQEKQHSLLRRSRILQNKLRSLSYGLTTKNEVKRLKAGYTRQHWD